MFVDLHNERDGLVSLSCESTRFVYLMYAEAAFMYLLSRFDQSDSKSQIFVVNSSFKNAGCQNSETEIDQRDYGGKCTIS